MKAIMVMFDSLNRRMLPPYGCDWTVAPNFTRLAEHAVTFDRSYVCSMPCMPARRDLHTGRPNFLHRSWGPLEPFDDSMPEMLKRAGVHTHLASDHYHYWEDGGATYHNRYGTWEFVRGQEGDPWIGQVADPRPAPNARGRNAAMDPYVRQDIVNRHSVRFEADRPGPRTFAAGIDYIRRNADQDNWFLHLETFDPHEPFYSDRRYKDLYPYAHEAMTMDWPYYRPVSETPEEVAHVRYEYAALLSQCDAYLGDLLDTMDELDLWKETMLIVWTDHGFMLGEHDCWAKIWMPMYQEVAHTPFFVWDPRCGARNERRQALVQPAIDLAPTLLEYFGLAPSERMLGQALGGTVAGDRPVREAAIFGMHGAQVNVTDGRYVYMRSGSGGPVYDYTVMPTHMRGLFPVERMAQAELAGPFPFTQGSPTLRIPGTTLAVAEGPISRNLLFDTVEDPGQTTPLDAPMVEDRMVKLMRSLMADCDAPDEQFARLGLTE